MSRRRTGREVGRQRDLVVSWGEMWTYRGVGHGKRREDCWIWTAVEEADGWCWVDFEVGGRGEEPSLRLYERLPEARLYRSDAYQVHQRWLSPECHVAGKEGEATGTKSRIRCGGIS